MSHTVNDSDEEEEEDQVEKEMSILNRVGRVEEKIDDIRLQVETEAQCMEHHMATTLKESFHALTDRLDAFVVYKMGFSIEITTFSTFTPWA